MRKTKFLRLIHFCFMILLIQVVSAENLGKMLSGYTSGSATYDSAWSVFVGGDLTLNPGAVRAEGRVFVRNNLTLATSSSYGVGASNGSVVRAPDGSEVLVVGNNLLGSGVFNLGNFGYRARVQNTSSADIAFGWWGSLPALQGGVDNVGADLLIADLQQKSAYWGSLDPTPGGSISSNAWHVYFRADGINGNPKLWVFNLDYDVMPSVNVEFIGFEPGDTILVNVKKAEAAHASSLSPSRFKVNSEFSSSINSRLIWNFPDAVTVELAGLSALPGAVLIANPSSTTAVSMPTHNGRFVTCGNLVHVPPGGPGGRVFNNHPFDGNLPDMPAKLFGYLFLDRNNDQVFNSGDTALANALVTLIVDGVPAATTNTGSDGYYEFMNVPTGVVTVQVVQSAATLVEKPVSGDPMRNRAVAGSVAGKAVIEYTAVAGQGVLSKHPGEPLNFGYSVHPLSTQLDLRVYAAADGRVMIEIATVNENGNRAIEVYAVLDGEWALVATVPADQIVGFGSNTYTVEAFGLAPGASYRFQIVDESGHIFESGLIQVASTQVTVKSLTLTPEMIKLSFTTKPGMAYQVMVCEAIGAPWKREYVQRQTARGWSELSNEPFTAGRGDKTSVLVPRNNRAAAFFKIIEVQ